MRKLSKVIFIAVVIVLMTRLIRVDAGVVPPEERIGADPFIVECTAYCDEGITASGKPTIEGLTIGGAREWIGCAVVLCDLHAGGAAAHGGCDRDGQAGYCVDRD